MDIWTDLKNRRNHMLKAKDVNSRELVEEDGREVSRSRCHNHIMALILDMRTWEVAVRAIGCFSSSICNESVAFSEKKAARSLAAMQVLLNLLNFSSSYCQNVGF